MSTVLRVAYDLEPGVGDGEGDAEDFWTAKVVEPYGLAWCRQGGRSRAQAAAELKAMLCTVILDGDGEIAFSISPLGESEEGWACQEDVPARALRET